MNPLGSLPGSSAPQFSLNGLDWQKILRFILVQAIGLFVTMGVPWLLGFTYILNGVDYTPYVVMAVNSLAEVLRRYVAGPAPAK